MSAWDEFVAFLKGTRPRPLPGPRSPLATALLLAAALLHLPVIYLVVASSQLSPPFTLGIGLASMGLAWSSGCSLEGRRPGTVRALATMGVAEAALAFLDPLADALGPARWLFLAASACSAAALIVLMRQRG